MEGHHPIEPYACLSHRWGFSKPLQLLKDNKVDFTTTIPWDSVPQLFKDAMTVAVQLGLRFIWIDSLCIVQDDDADWQTEAASMASIYKNARLTIAASAACGSEESLFCHCSPLMLGKSLETSSRCPYTVRQQPRHSVRITPHVFPLRTRGWAFQERLLSPRVVHFGYDEVVWECRELKKCECGYSNPTGDVALLDAFHKAVSPCLSKSFSEDARRLWWIVVEQYTRLELTYPRDRLMALAGVAQEIGAKYQAHLGRYFAGLWENELLLQYAWAADGLLSARPFPHVAPTWSWASITSPITYHKSSYIHTFQAEIIDIVTVPACPSPFGQIASGSATLKGPAIEGIVESTNPCIVAVFGRPFDIKEDYSLGVEGEGHIGDGTQVLLLAIVEHFYGAQKYLVLNPVKNEKDLFERIGIMQAKDHRAGLRSRKETKAYLDSHSYEKTVTII